MVCSLGDPVTQLDIRSHRPAGPARLGWHSPRDGAVGRCSDAVSGAGMKAWGWNQIYARNCARDAAGRAETEETQKIRNGLVPQACRGQRRDRRRPETADVRRVAIHNPATTGNASARRYVARTRHNRQLETGQRRITRGLLLGSCGMTCTDSTADRSDGTDCTGFSQRTVPRITCGRRWAIAGGVAPTAAAGAVRIGRSG